MEITVLDDLKYIHQRDAQDALGIAAKQWQQLEIEYDVPEIQGDFQNVVHAGMGGSALWAEVSRSWPGHKVPFEIVRDYDIPGYVSDKTLFIASSYSGNTEETLAALDAAEARGAHIAVIAGGGRLAEIARTKNYPLALLPKFEQPRFALLSGLKALVTLLERAGLVNVDEAEKTIHSSGGFLGAAAEAWAPTVPVKNNLAKQLALEVVGKSVVIYSGPKLFPAAYKWKISFNENAKNVAWCNQLPEFNHNEFIGWASHPVDKPYAIIELRSSLEHERTQKRFELSEKLLSGRRPAPEVVVPSGSNLLEQLLWSIALGDFVSIYTALLNGLNPTPVELVEKLKKELQ